MEFPGQPTGICSLSPSCSPWNETWVVWLFSRWLTSQPTPAVSEALDLKVIAERHRDRTTSVYSIRLFHLMRRAGRLTITSRFSRLWLWRPRPQTSSTISWLVFIVGVAQSAGPRVSIERLPRSGWPVGNYWHYIHWCRKSQPETRWHCSLFRGLYCIEKEAASRAACSVHSLFSFCSWTDAVSCFKCLLLFSLFFFWGGGREWHTR